MSNATAAPGQIDGRPLARPRQMTFLAAAALIGLTVIVYLSSFKNGFIWDDDAYILNNPTLRSNYGLQLIWLNPQSLPQYYPLVHTTFWLEYHAWGLKPMGYHVDNVLLHTANVVLLWILLRRLAVPWPWLAAAIFAVHPVQVESVGWITERKNVLSTFFYLLALLSYLAARPLDDSKAGRGAVGWYALSLLLFAMALASKTVTCSLPAAILVLIWWKRGRFGLRDILPLVPFFILGALGAAFTSWLESHHVDARGVDFHHTLIERCLIASRAVFFYAGKLLNPVDHVFMYPRWHIDSGAWWQYGYIVAAIAIVLALWMLRRSIGRGPLAAVLLFVGTLVPALGFFDVAPMRFSFVADHFQYLACVALIVLFVAALDRASRATWLTPAFIGAPLLLVLSLVTWNRQWAYADAETLWRDTIVQNPSSWMAFDNLGHIYLMQGFSDNAMNKYQRALDIAPGEPETHMAMAGGLYAQGKVDDAMKMYSEALKLDPTFAAAHFARGLIFEKRGQLAEAAKEYQAVIAIRDDYAPAHFHLGVFARLQDRIDDAKAEFGKTVLDDPLYAEAYYSLGNIELSRHHPVDASDEYRLALRADPDYGAAHYNLGVALKQMNDPTGAASEFRAAGASPDQSQLNKR